MHPLREGGAVKCISHTEAFFLHLHCKNLSRELLNDKLPISMALQSGEHTGQGDNRISTACSCLPGPRTVAMPISLLFLKACV